MSALLVAAFAAFAFITAYLTYGRWVAKRVFKLREDAPTPAVLLDDNRDYCPTKRSIVFGHHFTSIAGTGPIVGPAIAVMWGWIPALLWVVFGSILIGAVHDLGSLAVSLRSKGRTVGDIAGDLLGPRVRLIFLSILVMALWIVLAIFGLVIAAVLRQYPGAIFPVLAQIPLALVIGLTVHRKGANILIPSAIALALMYASVVFGDSGFLHDFNMTLASAPNWAWIAGLLAYAYIASVLPVWVLLQPRDYINALQLITSLGLLVGGLIAAATLGGVSGFGDDIQRVPLEFVGPAFEPHPVGAPPLIPILFITIACGAISGFHCLVSSGTTSKQLMRETDAQPVAYGGMLTEGFLATLVIIACAAGLGLGVSGAGGELLRGAEAFSARYESWSAAGSLSAKVAAFVDGSANLVRSAGVPAPIATALMAVLVASFAGTTMDTACRLQRYVIQELSRTFLPRPPRVRCPDCGYDRAGLSYDAPCPECGRGVSADEPHQTSLGLDAAQTDGPSPLNPFRWLATTHGATLLAVVTAALLAAIPAPGQSWTLANAGAGGLILWPLFGATNQLLGGLAFLVIGAWLIARRRPVWFIVPPALLMVVLPAWALTWQAFIGSETNPAWLAQDRWLLLGVSVLTLALEAWLVGEVVARLLGARRGRRTPAA